MLAGIVEIFVGMAPLGGHPTKSTKSRELSYRVQFCIGGLDSMKTRIYHAFNQCLKRHYM